MDQITPPAAGDDVRDLWKPVAANTRTINALGNLAINLRGQQNKLTLADGNATFELDLSDLLDLLDALENLSVESIEFCEGGVHGTRQMLCGPFVPDATSGS